MYMYMYVYIYIYIYFVYIYIVYIYIYIYIYICIVNNNDDPVVAGVVPLRHHVPCLCYISVLTVCLFIVPSLSELIS